MASKRIQVAPAPQEQEEMQREPYTDGATAEKVSYFVELLGKTLGHRPMIYGTPIIHREQIPGVTMLPPYRAPKDGYVLAGYELFFPGECGGPFACSPDECNWTSAALRCCCPFMEFGAFGCCLALIGCPIGCLTCCLKKHNKPMQRAVYAKPGTDIKDIIPPSSWKYVDA